MICDVANELDAELIVLGARGLSRVQSALGSVSAAVVQHARWRRLRSTKEGRRIRRPLQPASAASTYGIGDTTLMVEPRTFSEEEARDIGRRIGIGWTTSRFDVEQFRMGLEVELEHGRRDPDDNVSDDDEITTGKIAWAHLNEFPDYYTRFAQMEAEAERYWDERGRD